jgi:hypothetical protein
MRTNRGLYVCLTIAILLLGLHVGLCGCGSKPDLLDPPSKNGPPTANVPRATKPTTNSVYDNESNTAFVCAVVTKNGTPFYQPDHYLVFSRAISGAKRFSGPFGVLEQSGKALVKIVSGTENINGYYRARLVYIDDNSKETVVAEWASIPINRKNSLILELPIGEMARILSEPWGKPVEMVYPNNQTVLEGGGGWYEAIITLPKDIPRKDYVGVEYHLLTKHSKDDDDSSSMGWWPIYISEYASSDIFSTKFFVPWYAALALPIRLKLIITYSGKKYVVTSSGFSMELKRP